MNETEIKPGAMMLRGTENITVTAATRELTPGIWGLIEQMATVLYKSHMFGVTSVEQATSKMLMGWELGLGFTASLQLVQVVQGKPELSPRGALALIHNSPQIKKVEITRLTDGKGAFVGYSCTMERINGFSYTTQWTMADAQRAGLVKADSGWANYPENMCRWRAVGFCADVVAPDITFGMTTLMKAPEAYGVALTEGGDVVDVQATNVPTVDPVQVAVNELVTQYGAEQVLIAAGEIPTTMEKVEAVRKTLQEVQP